MIRIHRKTIEITLAALACCALAVSLVLVTSSAGANGVSRSIRGTISGMVFRSRVAPRLRQHFRVFRAQTRLVRTPDDAALPAGVDRSLALFASGEGPFAQFGLDTTQTIQIGGEAEDTVWVVPGQRGACVITSTLSDPAVTSTPATDTDCTSTSQALATGIVAVARGANGTHILYGLVPNGNSTIEADAPSGASTLVPVIDNTVAETLNFMPTSIRLRNGSGTMTQTP
jgi:hypothetical protein